MPHFSFCPRIKDWSRTILWLLWLCKGLTSCHCSTCAASKYRERGQLFIWVTWRGQLQESCTGRGQKLPRLFLLCTKGALHSNVQAADLRNYFTGQIFQVTLDDHLQHLSVIFYVIIGMCKIVIFWLLSRSSTISKSGRITVNRQEITQTSKNHHLSPELVLWLRPRLQSWSLQ